MAGIPFAWDPSLLSVSIAQGRLTILSIYYILIAADPKNDSAAK
jgi:hypothetical protein